MKEILQDELGFLGSWLFQIYPEKKIRIAQQRGHQEHLDVPRVQATLRGECE
jgi:hypothetical protein